MPRIQFSDVTPPEKRSIRDVPIPSGGKRKTPVPIKNGAIRIKKIAPAPVAPTTPPPPARLASESVAGRPASNFNSKMSEITEKKSIGSYEYYYPKDKKASKQNNGINKTKKKQIIFGGVILVLVGGFIIGMMTVLASATINITPKNQELDTNISIIGTSNKTEEDSVRYEILKLSSSKTSSVPATGEEEVELKSSGKIVVYNNFSSEPQRLIVRTRFENPEGLVYRIPESIVVPGRINKNGATIPGSIEVEVFADEVGE